jgi:hypothetical protein
MVEFSSTESTAEGSMSMIGVAVKRLLTAKGSWELAGCFGFEYQHIKQKVVDLRGWQFDFREVLLLERPDQVDSLTRYDFDLEIIGGSYEVRFFKPQIGLSPRYISGGWSLGLTGLVHPFLQVRDIDDHLIRGFQIRTSGRGFGYSGQLKIGYDAGKGQKKGLFFTLVGQYEHGAADVKGFRDYYRASGVLGDDDYIPVGTVWAEKHHVSTTQCGLRLSVGSRF